MELALKKCHLHCYSSRSFCEPRGQLPSKTKKLRETDTRYGRFNDFLTHFNQTQL